MAAEEMTAAERTELRRLLRSRFKVLRAEVARREGELKAEVAQGLSDRYAAQDAAIGAARAGLARIVEEAETEMEEVRRAQARVQENMRSAALALQESLRERHPELDVRITSSYQLQVTDRNRTARSQAAATAVPERVADALLDLDRKEADLLERIALGALASDAAREFLASLPTVAALVPSARLYELAGLDQPPEQ